MKAYETKKKLALSLAVAMVASSAPVLAFADTAIVAQAEAEMTVEEIIASVSAAINDPFLAAGLARIEAGEAAVATLPDGATKTALTETLQTARHMYDGLEQINQIWVALGAAGWQTNYKTEVAELQAIIAKLDAAFPGGSAFLNNFKTAVTETGLTYAAFEAMDVAAVNPTAANIAAAKEAVSKIMNPVAKANAQLRIQTEMESQELAVVSVSAITTTSIVVELSAAPTTPLTAGFFTVTGATVTSVAPGAVATRYVINIESLDGKQGNVTVNGKSIAYNFVAAAKAKVESVTFDNYRQFKVTYSEVVDTATATNPANYYFEIVEGQAGKLGAPAELKGNQSLANLASGALTATAPTKGHTDYVAFEAYKAATGLAGTTAAYWFYNMTPATVNGKTVVTIKMPQDARFGNSSLQIKSETAAPAFTGYEKLLNKDVTVNVAVRNVKTVDGVRSIDTAVFPMLISDTVRPEIVGASKQKLISAEKAEPVAFAPEKTTTVEVERVVTGVPETAPGANNGTLAPDLTHNLTLNFSEPVATNTEFKVYVNNVDKTAALVGEAFDTTGSYAGESTVTINLAKALGLTAHVEGDYKVDGKVHNIKVVAVKDLAGNITIPSTIEFNVKLVQPAQFGQEKPEVLGVEQIGDNVFRIQWNRAAALGKLNVLRSNGIEVTDVIIPASTHSSDENKYFSTVYLPSNDTDMAEDATNLEFMGQNFINRTFKITDMNVTGGGNPNTGKVFEQAVRVYKDIHAPELDEMYIVGKPANYDAVKAGAQKLVVSVADATPFGANAIKNNVLLMKYNAATGAVDMGAGVAKPVRVSYEKDGIVRSAEVVHGDLAFATNKLTIDLATSGAYASLLNKDSKLVEGATYTVELPEGFFADPAIFAGTNAAQGFVAADRKVTYGFTSLKITSNVTVPGQAADVILDKVPQTSKQLIINKYQPSVGRDEITVQFKGAIDPVTLKNPSNYTLNGKTLAAWGVTSSDIQYVVDGADINNEATKKYARFFAPKGSVTVDGAVEITIEGVANYVGGKMTPVTTTLVLNDNTAPAVISSKLDGAKNIVLTFDEAIAATVDAKNNFVVKVDGQIIAVETATDDGARALTLVLSQNVSSPTATIEIEVVEDNNGNIFVTDNSTAKNKLVKGTKINVQ